MSAELTVEEECQKKLFFGQQGEGIMEQKASGAESIAVVAGFLLAFGIDILLNAARDDFDSRELFIAYMAAMVVATSAGFCAVLLLTFTATKLRRLIGRSIYTFGQETDATEDGLVLNYGDQSKLAVKLREFECLRSNGIDKEIRFCARQWYYPQGMRLYLSALRIFVLEILFFVVAIGIRLFDALPLGAAVPLTVCVVVSSSLTLLVLYKTEAIRDLK